MLLSTGDDTLAAGRSVLVSALRLWDLSDRSILFPAADKSRAKKVTVDDTGRVRIHTASNEFFDAYLGADGRLQKEQGNATEIPSTLLRDYADSLRNATWAKSGNTFPGRLTPEEADTARELEGAGVGNLKLFAMPNNRLGLLAPAEDNPASLVLLRSLGGHTARIVAAGMSPKGRFIASIDEQGRVLAWDLLRPAFVREIEKKLADPRNMDRSPAQAKQDLENLARWFNIRGRGDLAQQIME
jgi:hypothetical protein